MNKRKSGFSWSHNYYAQLGNSLQKHFLVYSALKMRTLKSFTGQFFNFSVQSQNSAGDSNGSDFP